MKSVKIGACLFLLTVATYLPSAVGQFSGGKISEYFSFIVYINNFGNFFVYLAIDEQFRGFILRRG